MADIETSDAERTDAVANSQCFRLLDVLPELLVHIFSFLPNSALYEVQQTSRFLRDFIGSSVELQYQMAAETAQVTDNPTSPIPISERLRKLHAREEAFGEVEPSWKVSVPVNFQPTGLYELSAGLFWLGEGPRRALRFLELPSQPLEPGDPPPQWQRITLPSKESYIIDFGLAIEEHDLIAIASFTPTDNANTGLVQLELFTVSAPHGPHPEAQGPIKVHTSKWGKPNVIIEIVGDNLVFVVGYANAEGTARPTDVVYVYDWKTGKQKLNIAADWSTYFGAVFLSPDVIMLPNTTSARLELWSVAEPQKTPLLTLHLPRLVPGRTIRYMTARGEPNPQASYRKPRSMPFHSSVEDSIIVFQISLPSEPDLRAYRFLLFIHRRALLALLDNHAPGDSCGYADWGPDICRWFNGAGLVMDWITTTSGQRCVLLPNRVPSQFIMLDFNPIKALSSPLEPEEDAFVDLGIWAEPVCSRLPCHVASSRELANLYSGASLDDHRIIALRRNLFRQVSELDIHYFG
ncbi:F-box domain-containing protein [Mycena venus]|uniref:F-box domain-containing protein n=1 Tax=Mycena venus TaxID=2733690 RepID=A0A8H7CLE3_9AGAR|nr:F-box domain-containing protein [Mycena venus]